MGLDAIFVVLRCHRLHSRSILFEKLSHIRNRLHVLRLRLKHKFVTWWDAKIPDIHCECRWIRVFGRDCTHRGTWSPLTSLLRCVLYVCEIQSLLYVLTLCPSLPLLLRVRTTEERFADLQEAPGVVQQNLLFDQTPERTRQRKGGQARRGSQVSVWTEEHVGDDISTSRPPEAGPHPRGVLPQNSPAGFIITETTGLTRLWFFSRRQGKRRQERIRRAHLVHSSETVGFFFLHVFWSCEQWRVRHRYSDWVTEKLDNCSLKSECVIDLLKT